MLIYNKFSVLLTVAVIVFFTSCSILEKASVHGLDSGYYNLNYGNKTQEVYVDVTDEIIDVYHQAENIPDTKFLSIQLKNSDSLLIDPLVFQKQSLDVDITTILLKYRQSAYELPPQMTTEFNAALYAGWRHDNYKIVSKKDPLGRANNKISNFGYDFGVFAGPGATEVTPFTTDNKSINEYSGMIIQMGVAGFLESNIASFGIAAGFDYMLNRDRKIWIYNNKPWVGFIIGIAFD